MVETVMNHINCEHCVAQASTPLIFERATR